MWFSIAFAVFLVVISIVLIVRHQYVWRSVQCEELSQRQRQYLRRQYRRRMKTSAMIGIAGLLVAGGVWVPGLKLKLIYWIAVLLLVLWTIGLALADIASTRAYFREVFREHQAEHEALKKELSRLRSREGNGRPEEVSGDARKDDEEA